MKTLLGVAAGGLIGVSMVAQNYSVTWKTADGGGGTSAGGGFTTRGTVGQPDAGPRMVGGAYAVTGGFWALPIAVQSPDSPTLAIASVSPGRVRISWDSTTTGYVLQQTDRIDAPNWVNSPSGSLNPVTVVIGAEPRYYRLRKP